MKALYQEKIKPLVDPLHFGKFVVIDVETGDYEIGKRMTDASKVLCERRPEAINLWSKSRLFGSLIVWVGGTGFQTMIPGRVNWLREATIHVEVQDASGNLHRIQCILDTGFDGDLTLSSAVIGRLRLVAKGSYPTVLANGDTVHLPAYSGIVSWHGHRISVEVLEAQQSSVVGMALLENSTLTIQAWDGGEVFIEERA